MFSIFRECPQKYAWTKARRPSDFPYKNQYAFLGILVQRVIEDFYNEKLYLMRENCRAELHKRVPRLYRKILIENPIKLPDGSSEEDFLQTVHDGVDKYLDMIVKYKLLGEYAQSEVPLMANITRTQTISGTLDILVVRNDEIIIADGKGTRKDRDAVDPLQLMFYALLYYLRNEKPPDKLAFLLYLLDDYYQVPFTMKDLMDLQIEVSDVMKKIKEKAFDPTPSREACFFCDFQIMCPAYNEQIRKKPPLDYQKDVIISLDD